MPLNHLVQKPSQAWIWEPPMDSHQLHHHYFQVDQEQEGNYRREHMFEKPLTPSDVGKLNRLVIPKQHAEKYFPLNSESGEKGLLLSFEDELGKAWRFRYSYWTSSQSYVLTKGWSRFVKEKRLDTGDIVLFERFRRGNGDCLYIGCRRRGSPDTRDAAGTTTPAQTAVGLNAALPWSPAFYAASSSYPNSYFSTNSVYTGEQASSAVESTAATATGNSKRLRLFGVNLECGPDRPEPQHLASGSWSQFMPTNASTSQL